MSKYSNSYKIRRRIAEMAGKRQLYQKKHGKASFMEDCRIKSTLRILQKGGR